MWLAVGAQSTAGAQSQCGQLALRISKGVKQTDGGVKVEEMMYFSRVAKAVVQMSGCCST